MGAINILNKWHLNQRLSLCTKIFSTKLWFYRNLHDSLKSLATLPKLFKLICSGDWNTELSFKPNLLFRIPNLDHVLHEKHEMLLRHMFWWALNTLQERVELFTDWTDSIFSVQMLLHNLSSGWSKQTGNKGPTGASKESK